MTSEIYVTKRNGDKEPLDLDKFHKVVSFACEGISGVSASEIEMQSRIQFANGIKTSDIQETLIKAAAGLISEETPNYQHVAGRLINYHLRKEVYGQYEPPHLYEHVTHMCENGWYDQELLTYFDEKEWDQLNKIVDHRRDDRLSYAAMEQFRGKYLVQDRVTGQIHETPQMAYLLIAAVLFHDEPKGHRMKWIKDYYDAISQHYISLASPILAGIRTDERQYSSCVLIEAGDSLDSIIAVNGAVMKYISARAGIGIHGGNIRGEMSPVKNGKKSHTGIRPYWRGFQSSVRSCSQGGMRNGAATMNYPFFNIEFDNLIVLKNNKGTEDNRLRHMDYCVHLNGFFLRRYLSGGNITLFSANDVPDLYDAFYRDSARFEELYVKYEKNPRIRKITMPAAEMLSKIVEERFNTGRVYLMFVDHANDHGAFISQIAPIKMTNLCVEITLPTDFITSNPDEGEISVCTLSALNFGTVTLDTMEHYCRLAVRGLNKLIDYQDYPAIQAERSTKNRRPLGVGIISLAYWMAKNGMTYTEANLNLLDEWMEAMAYYLINASIELAEIHGPCPLYNQTKYSQGIMPIHTYKKAVDALVSRAPSLDWDGLAERAKTIGMYNSTLVAFMPGESSSIAAGGTSGVDPVKSLITYKQSKDGVLAQVVPGIRKYGKAYQTQWDMPHTRGVLEVAAVLNKWADQSGSWNTSYNPLNYPDNKVPESELIGDILYAYKLGLKTLYYNNTNDLAGEEETETPGELPEIEEADCEACKM